MKRLQRWKRKKFDAILSNPTRLLLVRLLVLSLLAGAVVEAWLARTYMVERMDWAGTQMRRLVALDDSVETLKSSASEARLDSTRNQAFRGVFADWDELAAWLETQRKSALKQGWALEWKLTESGKEQPYPFLHRQEVVLHLTMSESDYPRARSFLRSTTESDRFTTSLVRLQGIGDEEGITELNWTLLVWVRNTHG